MKRNKLLIIFLIMQAVAFAQKKMPIFSPIMAFKENKGQITDQEGNQRKDIDFVLETPNLVLSLGEGQIHYQFIKIEENSGVSNETVPNGKNPTIGSIQNVTRKGVTNHKKPFYHASSETTITAWRVDMMLINANKKAVLLKEDTLQEKFNYYKGIPGMKAITDVSAFRKITYKDIYPNIDWVLYIQDEGLKYDFIVHPGGKISDIKLQYSGADSVWIDKEGHLQVKAKSGLITEKAPYCYEKATQKLVTSKFIKKNNIIEFKTAAFNGTLVIDPGVDWASYFGGPYADMGTSIASAPDGSIFLAGVTHSSSQIATIGSFQTVYGGGDADAYIAKFDSQGKLQWATYYGGNGSRYFLNLRGGAEYNVSVACDNFGHVYLTGTSESNFPVSNLATPKSFQDSFRVDVNANTPGSNIFLVQFNQQGVRQWSTYYGASTSSVTSTGLTCDRNGNVYLIGNAGISSSSIGALVTQGAHQTLLGGKTDGLLVKFDSSGKRQWATYYGGSEIEDLKAVTCDQSGNVYIAGSFFSTVSPTGIATHKAYDDTVQFGTQGFLAKFTEMGKREWGTYLRGKAYGLTTDPFNNLYVAGQTWNQQDTFIYTPNAHRTYVNSKLAGFLLQFNSSTGQRKWGTYYGGEGETSIDAITSDRSGNIYICGNTKSFGLGTYEIATANSYQDTLNADQSSRVKGTQLSDAFVAQFDSAGVRQWGTYYGGPGQDIAKSISCGSQGSIYIAGTTQSATAIATPGSHQDQYAGSNFVGLNLLLSNIPGDAFLVRFLPVDIAIKSFSPAEDTLCSGLFTAKINVKNQGGLNKTDTLRLRCEYGIYDGNTIENLHTFSLDGLSISQEKTFDLGTVTLHDPGLYQFKIYSDYTRDDAPKKNDTLKFRKFVIAAPKAEINHYHIGNTYYFSNKNSQPTNQYLWNFGDGTTSTLFDPLHIYIKSGTYQVNLNVTNECGSDTTHATVSGIERGTSVKLAEQNTAITVFPIPTRDLLYVTVDQKTKLQNYTILNGLGQKVMQGALDKYNSISVQHLTSGIYQIEISTDQGSIIRRFVINK